MNRITPEFVAEKITQWEPELKNPLWYEKVVPDLIQIWQGEIAENEKGAIRDSIYHFFEEKLYSGGIAIAAKGPDFDQWRKPIDTVVVHHTSGKSGVSWKRLSTIGFLRQYALDFFRFDDQYGEDTKGQAIWSNHFREVDGHKVPVFYAYHWMVRSDGSVERLLTDNEIGWQAGNGDINFRSVAIVLDGDFTEVIPTNEMVVGIKDIIGKHYQQVGKDRIFGHREINPNTICPGDLFMSEWKNRILDKPE